LKNAANDQMSKINFWMTHFLAKSSSSKNEIIEILKDAGRLSLKQ